MHVVVPAGVLHRLFTLVVAIAVAVALLPLPASAAPAVDPRDRTAAERAGEQHLFDAHNQARRDPGRFGYPGEDTQPALEWDDHLADVARQWSDVMAADQRMRHNPHYPEQADWPTGAGENVAHSGWGTGNVGASGLMQMWMDSCGHRDNIMRDRYTAVGIGVSIDHRGQLWATAVFGVDPAEAAPAPPEQPGPPDQEEWDSWGDRVEAVDDVPPPPTPNVRDLSGLCPPVTTSRFVDVATHIDAVECLANLAITSGTGSGRFSPHDPVTRGQLAVFVDRAARKAGTAIPDGTSRFSDVTGSQADAVARLVAAGIVSGYPNGTYRPHQPVTREQMAHFLVATHEYLQGSELPGPSRSWFVDNRADGQFDRQVNLAADLGFTAGNQARYNHRCPVRRDHMALFLLRLIVAQDDDGFEQVP